MAYSSLEFQKATKDMSLDSYLWNIGSLDVVYLKHGHVFAALLYLRKEIYLSTHSYIFFLGSGSTVDVLPALCCP